MPTNAELLAERERAVRRSLDYLRPDMRLGLGAGTTLAMLVPLIGAQVRAGLRLRAVCASARTRALAEQAGIPLLADDDFDRLDLTIDGADEIDPQLRTIKGGGGALLHEKVIAAASAEVVLIADSRKPVARLGAFPLPVEVVPFGWRAIARQIAALGTTPRLRTAAGTDQPFVTDEGNYIVDCPFGAIADPDALAARIAAIPGVAAHGLFIGLATRALVGRGDTVEVLTKK